MAAVSPPQMVEQLDELSFLLLGIGIILFGVATFMARVYPRWAPVLLIASIPVTMFLPATLGTFSESIGQILLGIAVVVLDWYALRRAPSSTSLSQGRA